MPGRPSYAPGEARAALAQGPILLYDGECGVCSTSVQWILKHERRHQLRFAPLEGKLGAALRKEAGVSAEVDSLLWIEAQEERIHAYQWSDAVLKVVSYMGGVWRFARAAGLIPKPVRDAAYRVFARHRRGFAPDQCLFPPPETRARFLLD